jgi:hypothetical protein
VEKTTTSSQARAIENISIATRLGLELGRAVRGIPFHRDLRDTFRIALKMMRVKRGEIGHPCGCT